MITGGDSAVEAALSDRDAWVELIRKRRRRLRQFLLWSAACERCAPHTSLRFEHRDDIARCRATLDLFAERWWGVAVYSCFDSERGTDAAAQWFHEPLSVGKARRLAYRANAFPPRSVQNHRAQATLKRARVALVSICDNAGEIKRVMCASGATFDQRLNDLEALDIDGWGRTTYFDTLARAGILKVGRSAYRPRKAYLADSTGPKKGFGKVWGVEPGGRNADACEQLLRRWTRDWLLVAREVDVGWIGRPYDSADFENALCVFQERPTKARPNSAAFARK